MWFQHLNETEIILAVLAAFYLSECVYWISHRAVCFYTMGLRFHPRRTISFLSNDRNGLVFTLPVPFAISFVCEPWPVFVSPKGIYMPDVKTTPSEPIPHCDVNYVSFREDCSVELSDRDVRVNGNSTPKFSSTSQARFFKASLEEISRSCPHAREEVIEKTLKAMTDLDAIKQRLSTLRREILSLKVFSTSLFLYTFGLGPAIYYFADAGVAYRLSIYLVGFAAYWLLAIFCFCSAHRRLYPDGVAERRKCCAMMVLSPAEAMRGPSILSKHLLESFHPVAVAAVVSSPQVFLEYAKPFLLDLQYPMPTLGRTDDSASYRTETWFRDCLKSHLSEVVRQTGIDVANLVKAPIPDPDAQSYCPRCQSQFVVSDGICESCDGLRLQPFEKSRNETGSHGGSAILCDLE